MLDTESYDQVWRVYTASVKKTQLDIYITLKHSRTIKLFWSKFLSVCCWQSWHYWRNTVWERTSHAIQPAAFQLNRAWRSHWKWMKKCRILSLHLHIKFVPTLSSSITQHQCRLWKFQARCCTKIKLQTWGICLWSLPNCKMTVGPMCHYGQDLTSCLLSMQMRWLQLGTTQSSKQ